MGNFAQDERMEMAGIYLTETIGRPGGQESPSYSSPSGLTGGRGEKQEKQAPTAKVQIEQQSPRARSFLDAFSASLPRPGAVDVGRGVPVEVEVEVRAEWSRRDGHDGLRSRRE